MFGQYENIFFKDRKDAGEQLGLFLEAKYKTQNPLIIGIPRGGVEVAYYVAKQLNAELSLIVSKKLPLPNHKEYGIGAIAEEDSVYIAQTGKELVSEKVINQIIKEQKQEVDRRVNEYRHGKPLPTMKDRVVILVDDGIATGVTLVPVIELCERKKAAKIIIAAPVSGSRFDENLYKADEIEIMVKPQPFYAVGQVYDVFGDFNDDDLLKLLDLAEH
ncbi:phosphoribosyltransferase [Albibacterium bauzanense]|uniref:Putative phosphoribosyltransferase n=1 Tax=Albibacterium bauzanense TaxID=653929 RepID=A0A4R1LP09_9SPHI|nr:phosphoribosyltransferase family protein [Albibacterium bauzanense]TCK80796.1 putative phosphoribosyltransferase [Albibacterium bauzanense]